MKSRFEQINVFATHSLKGNPLAVVHCQEEDYSTETMQALARWTQLSETVFITPATEGDADYKVRIFTPAEELPFAGHPTLGACHSWLNGRKQAVVHQQSAMGIVEIRQEGNQLFFEAPPLVVQRPFSTVEQQQLIASTGLLPEAITATKVLSNGPVWHCVKVDSVETLLSITPDYSAMGDLKLGLCSLNPEGEGLVVRALVGVEATEDPVTGSLQAVLAQWLIETGELPEQYHAQQGACVGAEGEITIKKRDGKIYVGGHSTRVISGDITLPTD
ncbi:phenazine biosynthesis protein PhzF family [Rosenbergiella nectarea]|uniref:Phenazine biosynthesis protein PhzF family n=1 Tax=Rosenbergiella nectarea TaxID=988801 RepID=A0A1H9JVU0_9GAMM|nr:PhzF family phenazine biosynthesis protein [Rosenbergiella nectarea]SEQ90958.1 phenazine biosynthesis protein PhzF family [Rosenbergiella nectarea]